MIYKPGDSPYFDNLLALRKKGYTYLEIAGLVGSDKDSVYSMFKVRNIFIGRRHISKGKPIVWQKRSRKKKIPSLWKRIKNRIQIMLGWRG